MRETLDMIMTAAAFDQTVTLLFLDDGVYQLKHSQDAESPDFPPLARWWDALSMYGVDDLRVEAESLEERALCPDDLGRLVRPVARTAVAALIRTADVVVPA